MKLQLKIEVEGSDDHCEAVLEELEAIINDGEIVHIKSASDTHVEFIVISYKEMPATGRDKGQHPDQLTFDDIEE